MAPRDESPSRRPEVVVAQPQQDVNIAEERESDIFYITKSKYETLKTLVKCGETSNVATGKVENATISKQDIDELTFPDEIDENEIMIPVDMRGCVEEYEDVEDMIEKLGCVGVVKAFMSAREHFLENEGKKEDCPKEMTAGGWRAVLEEDDMSELEEETDVGEDLPEGNEISDTEEDDDNDSPRAKRRKEEEDEYEK